MMMIIVMILTMIRVKLKTKYDTRSAAEVQKKNCSYYNV